MTFIYAGLDLLFALLALLVFRNGFRGLNARAVLVTLVGVTLLTLGFDNLIVGLHIVAYHQFLTLNLTVPIAPIEDFSYAVVGALALPAIWNLLAGFDKTAAKQETSEDTE